ncbi:Perlucin-like protein [Holothuria leucospilota]|uniref:Perlucin-like protein n=1 Tax=Holothuria leucospilota TaxID=206669 RepID=A0A9Q0YB77_HOLLE|nr:Perlucin-like protein [Holothuria leucospilota]
MHLLAPPITVCKGLPCARNKPVLLLKGHVLIVSLVWSKYNSSCYLVIQAEKNWTDAKHECCSYDAHLVFIESDAENSFIIDLLEREFNSSSRQSGVWLGLTKEMEGEIQFTAAKEKKLVVFPKPFFSSDLGATEGFFKNQRVIEDTEKVSVISEKITHDAVNVGTEEKPFECIPNDAVTTTGEQPYTTSAGVTINEDSFPPCQVWRHVRAGEGLPQIGVFFRFRRGALVVTIKYKVPDGDQSPRRSPDFHSR